MRRKPVRLPVPVQGEEEEDDSSAATASRYELLEKGWEAAKTCRQHDSFLARPLFERGTAGCPIDLEIASVTECQNALKAR